MAAAAAVANAPTGNAPLCAAPCVASAAAPMRSPRELPQSPRELPHTVEVASPQTARSALPREILPREQWEAALPHREELPPPQELSLTQQQEFAPHQGGGGAEGGGGGGAGRGLFAGTVPVNGGMTREQAASPQLMGASPPLMGDPPGGVRSRSTPATGASVDLSNLGYLCANLSFVSRLGGAPARTAVAAETVARAVANAKGVGRPKAVLAIMKAAVADGLIGLDEAH